MTHRLTLLAVALFAQACAPALIAGTRVEDTPLNREIHAVVEAYRVAMETRDLEKLKQLISPKYYENASSTHTDEDDYGHDKLEKSVMPMLRDNVKKVQYRIQLNRVTVKDNRAYADYEFVWKFLFVEGGREAWNARNDFNRLVLEKDNGSWKIVEGL